MTALEYQDSVGPGGCGAPDEPARRHNLNDWYVFRSTSSLPILERTKTPVGSHNFPMGRLDNVVFAWVINEQLRFPRMFLPLAGRPYGHY